MPGGQICYTVQWNRRRWKMKRNKQCLRPDLRSDSTTNRDVNMKTHSNFSRYAITRLMFFYGGFYVVNLQFLFIEFFLLKFREKKSHNCVIAFLDIKKTYSKVLMTLWKEKRQITSFMNDRWTWSLIKNKMLKTSERSIFTSLISIIIIMTAGVSHRKWQITPLLWHHMEYFFTSHFHNER